MAYQSAGFTEAAWTRTRTSSSPGSGWSIPGARAPRAGRTCPGRSPSPGTAAFSAARDEAGNSRRQGGIHFPDADNHGRTLGASVGQAAWDKAQGFFTGTAGG